MSSLIDRASRAEQRAASIYDVFAERFANDRTFWAGLAEDERRHARNLVEWRRLLEHEPPDRQPVPIGYDTPLDQVERALDDAVARAAKVSTPDDAFWIALDIEASALDSIYTELLQSSPLNRYPDLKQTQARELDRHHRSLVRAIRAHGDDEALQARADFLELGA